MRYIVLLRGVNVGGRGKLPMGDLRTLLQAMGHTDVMTYLQSGNVLLTSSGEDPSQLGREIEQAIERDVGMNINVLIRTPEELARVMEGNPFPAGSANPTRLHVSFLSGAPDTERLAAIDPQQFEPDEFRVGERAVYLWYPNGSGRTKLSNDFWERRLGLTATTRNWNTVTTLLSMATQGTS